MKVQIVFPWFSSAKVNGMNFLYLLVLRSLARAGTNQFLSSDWKCNEFHLRRDGKRYFYSFVTNTTILHEDFLRVYRFFREKDKTADDLSESL